MLWANALNFLIWKSYPLDTIIIIICNLSHLYLFKLSFLVSSPYIEGMKWRHSAIHPTRHILTNATVFASSLKRSSYFVRFLIHSVKKMKLFFHSNAPRISQYIKELFSRNKHNVNSILKYTYKTKVKFQKKLYISVALKIFV